MPRALSCWLQTTPSVLYYTSRGLLSLALVSWWCPLSPILTTATLLLAAGESNTSKESSPFLAGWFGGRAWWSCPNFTIARLSLAEFWPLWWASVVQRLLTRCSRRLTIYPSTRCLNCPASLELRILKSLFSYQLLSFSPQVSIKKLS